MLDDDILTDYLHSVELVLPLVSDKIDFSKSAPTDNADQLKVIPGHFYGSIAPIEAQRAAILTTHHLIELSIKRPSRQIVSTVHKLISKVDALTMDLISLISYFIQLKHHSLIGVVEGIPLHSRWAERQVSFRHSFDKIHVFFVDSGQNEGHARDSSLHVFLCGAIVSEGALFKNSENWQIFMS